MAKKGRGRRTPCVSPRQEATPPAQPTAAPMHGAAISRWDNVHLEKLTCQDSEAADDGDATAMVKSGTADDFVCEMDCGFRSSFSEVEAHENTCEAATATNVCCSPRLEQKRQMAKDGGTVERTVCRSRRGGGHDLHHLLRTLA